MPRYNTQFELTVEDLDVIESALREVKTKLRNERLRQTQTMPQIADEVSQIHDLLGRSAQSKGLLPPQESAHI